MKQLKYITLFISLLIVTACNKEFISYDNINRPAKIHPEYTGTYIPYNIAPLNFQIDEDADQYLIRFVTSKDSFEIKRKKNTNIPLRKWKSLLEKSRGEDLFVKIFALENGTWKNFEDMRFFIPEEAIDPYVAYRLIEPGYETWGKMGIYQRCLENFNESPILTNTLTDNNCMNCHSFHNNDPETMLFHLRANLAGTIFVKDGKIRKLATQAPWMISAGVYPRWHPSGNYVAFSTNNTEQSFLASHANKVEVFDTASDIVLYDVQHNRMSTDNSLHSAVRFETFPEWSPDGRFLYFCSAPAAQLTDGDHSIKYDLVRVGFNPETGNFTNRTDTIISARETGKSVSFARISPDGKYLVFCLTDYGTFPIWHRENDLHMLDLETGDVNPMAEVNSEDSDSYHSWSSNGRWMMFGSRRIDGSYTRLFITYFDTNGQWHKPFLMPQKNPEYYDYLLKSYNIPEFITGKVRTSPQKLAKVARKTAIELNP